MGRDALGREVVTETVLQQPAPGHGVMLTIDRTIQYLAEREIDAAWRRTQAKAAMAVVLDPRNGDVLAMAVRPTFNPERLPRRALARALAQPRGDRSFRAGLDLQGDPGRRRARGGRGAARGSHLGRERQHHDRQDHDPRLEEVRLADLRRGVAELLERRLHQGGAGARARALLPLHDGALASARSTGVGLAGESRGQLRDPQRWSALSLPTMSIGQEVSVTALQMVAAFGAIANGGTLMQPRLVRSRVRRRGQGDPPVRAEAGAPGDLRPRRRAR